MDVKYKVTVSVKELTKGLLKTFTKTITKKNVNLEYNIPILISNDTIPSYVDASLRKYCKENSFNMQDLSIHSYKIESKTDNVHVYCKSEDVTQRTASPNVYAIYNESNKLKLFCEQVDECTIKWYWDEPIKNSLLIDEKNNVIAKINEQDRYYIESDLEQNRTYTRRILTNDDRSLDCSLTLSKCNRSTVYTHFIEEERDETIVLYDNLYGSRMTAFNSGIGDNLDCKIFKPYDATYGKTFRLLNKIYGIRASNVVKHHTVKFKYRYKMKGIIDYPSYDGFVKARVTATPIDNNGNSIGATIYCTKDLEYSFDTEVQTADIYIEDILPELEQSYRVKYKFTITLSEVKGKLSIYSYTLGYRKNIFDGDTITFEEKGFYNHKINISSAMVTKQMEYIEYYPSKEFEPLVCVVNGDFEVTESGKKDYIETSYAFAPPESVYDKKYYCDIEEISPTSAYVKYKFNGEATDKDYTTINGDTIVFSSDAIIENDMEYRDFISQIEEGEYYIDDNRKHTYEYVLKDIKVDVTKYKRFELDIDSTSNDIYILDSTKVLKINENNEIHSNVKVTVRAVNNAIARWEPLIHNGYYYYNQEERFLYTKCMVDGDNKILDNVFTKYRLATKVLVEASQELGPVENYDISKRTKEELWLNRKLYFWYQNRIWTAPISVSGKYYEFLEEYIYETEPFIFNNTPTSLSSITWEQVCMPNNSIETYAISYNEIYGEWNEPILLTHNQPIPEKLKLSKIIKLKFIMKPSRLPDLVTQNILFSCENDWHSSRDSYLSSNLYYKKEHISPKSKKSDGQYISTIYDLGDTKLELKERSLLASIKYNGNVEMYVQEADLKSDLSNSMNNSSWRKITINEVAMNLKRFVRFKLIISPNSKIFYMNLTLTRYEYNDNYSSYMPSIGNIRIAGEYNPSLATKFYEQVVSKLIPFDCKYHPIINNLHNFIYQMSVSQKFEFNNIVSFSVSPYGEMKNDYEISYNQSSITTEPVNVKSKTEDYDVELIEENQNGVVFNVSNNTLKVNPLPQQYSPIIISEENEYMNVDTNPLTNVFFVDNDGSFSLYNIEEFTSLGFKTLYLQYTDVDEASVIVEVNGEVVKDFFVTDNVIEFKYNVGRDLNIKVKYMLKNSFCVNYDYLNDEAIINFNKYNGASVSKVRVHYEVDKNTSLRKLKDINLNPIYNSRYSGYIYICDYTLEPKYLYIYPSTTFVHANGKDEISILILVKDENMNPVENIPINVAVANGQLIKETETTDNNGIIKCIYTSSKIECIDEIKAIYSNDVKAETTIVNRKL